MSFPNQPHICEGDQMNFNSAGRLVVLVLVAQFGACVNVPQSGQQDAAQLARQQEGIRYCNGLYADSRLDPIRHKVPLALNIADPIPVVMMGNSEFPTEDEAQLILLWAQHRQDCHKRQTELLGSPPAHFLAFRMANAQAIAELYARRITFGQLAGQLNQNTIAYMQQDQALKSQAQRDAAQAQQAFAQTLMQQQQLNLQNQILLNQQRQPPLPRRNPVNCTTQYIGNTAYTNCN
jgi:hypothetical protein